MRFRSDLPAAAATVPAALLLFLLICAAPCFAATPAFRETAMIDEWEQIRNAFTRFSAESSVHSPGNPDRRIALAGKTEKWVQDIESVLDAQSAPHPPVFGILASSAVPAGKDLASGLRKGLGQDQLSGYVAAIERAMLVYARERLAGQERFNRLFVYLFSGLVLLFLLVASIIFSFRSRFIRSSLKESHSAEFARQIIRVQEAERTALARELHDTIAQDLLCIKMATEALRRTVSRMDTRYSEDFNRLVDQEAECIHQIRSICTELRPPELEHLGLKPALASLCDNFGMRSGIQCRFLASGFESVGPECEIHCYRIVQEALNNVRKHSQAREVLVQLTGIRGSRLCILIEDDGAGFDTEAVQTPGSRKFGLAGIRERIHSLDGTLSIQSSKDGGTAIYATIPLTSPALRI